MTYMVKVAELRSDPRRAFLTPKISTFLSGFVN